MAQRLVRAKAKIRAAGIPYQTPPRDRLDERIDGVLAVAYLVFTEAYAGDPGRSLAGEAIGLARRLEALLPGRGAIQGLLALMLLHEARRPARWDGAGDIVLLEDQDRALWRRADDRRGPGPGPEPALEGSCAALPLRRAGRHRRPARPRRHAAGDRLAPDRRPLRRADAARALAGGGAQPRRRARHGRRPRRRPAAHRRPGRPRRAGRLRRPPGRPRRRPPPPRPCAAEASARLTKPTRCLPSPRHDPERRFFRRRLAELLAAGLASAICRPRKAASAAGGSPHGQDPGHRSTTPTAPAWSAIWRWTTAGPAGGRGSSWRMRAAGAAATPSARRGGWPRPATSPSRSTTTVTASRWPTSARRCRESAPGWATRPASASAPTPRWRC